MRTLTLVVLVIALLSTPSRAAVLIAPISEDVQLLAGRNFDPDGATNGSNSLVVWTYAVPQPAYGAIVGRIVDSGNRNGPLISFHPLGSRPTVASNGRDYLVGYGIAYNHGFPVGSAGLQRVTADGTKAGSKVLDPQSSGGSVGDIVWNGTNWIVGFAASESAHVAILDENLELIAPAISLGRGAAPSIEKIAGRWWAVYVDTASVGHVIEIGTSGPTGVAYSVAAVDRLLLAAIGNHAVAAITTGTPTRIELRLFDPASGFSDVTARSEESTILDLEPWSGSVFLASSTQPSHLSSTARLSSIGANGAVDRSVSVAASDVAMIESEFGPSILYKRVVQNTSTTAIIMRSMRELPADGSELGGEEVSIDDRGRHTPPVLGSTGSTVVAFWLQKRVSDSQQTLHSRAIDERGRLTGPVVPLPLEDVIPLDVCFDGTRFTLVGTRRGEIVAVNVSSDGLSIGAPALLGFGYAPQVATSGGRTLVVWNQNDSLRGTTIGNDANPDVAGGFYILPTTFESAPASFALHALADGFQIVVGGAVAQSVTLTPSGYLRSLAVLSDVGGVNPVSDGNQTGALAAWTESEKSILYNFRANGEPIVRTRSPWADSTIPIAITSSGDGDYTVMLRSHVRTLVSEVTAVGTIGASRSLGTVTVSPTPMASIGSVTLVGYQNGEGIWVERVDEIPIPRRRAAGR